MTVDRLHIIAEICWPCWEDGLALYDSNTPFIVNGFECTYIGFCIAEIPVDDIWLFTQTLLQLNHMLPNDVFCQWCQLI
jgi:hypothetical protein